MGCIVIVIVIDRNGLRCLSNTKLMSTGSVMGQGIYLSTQFAYSARYATPGWHWTKGMYKDGLHVVSICESPSSSIKTGIISAGGTFVVPKEHQGNLAVRFLLVFRCDDKIPEANFVDGHILSYGDHTVDLSQHYERIRKKYSVAI